MSGETGGSIVRASEVVSFALPTNWRGRVRMLRKVADMILREDEEQSGAQPAGSPCAGRFPQCAWVETYIDENLDCFCIGHGCPGQIIEEC